MISDLINISVFLYALKEIEGKKLGQYASTRGPTPFGVFMYEIVCTLFAHGREEFFLLFFIA